MLWLQALPCYPGRPPCLSPSLNGTHSVWEEGSGGGEPCWRNVQVMWSRRGLSTGKTKPSQFVGCWDTSRMSWGLSLKVYMCYATTEWKTNPALLAAQQCMHNTLRKALSTSCPLSHVSVLFFLDQRNTWEILDLCNEKGGLPVQ